METVNINLTSLIGDKQFKRLELLLGKILMNQGQLATQLNANADQLGDLATKVQGLLDAVANQSEITPELQAAADRVDTAIRAINDLKPSPEVI